MSGDPFAFDYRTANDLVKLLKRTRNGEFAAELNDTIPLDQSAKFVWAYVPTSVTATYDSTVKAWKIGSNQVYLPINISKDGTGQVQWGMINDDGTYAGGITCTIYTPKLSSNQAAPKVGVGFYLGMVFGTDASNNPTVLIGLPPVSGSGGSGGSAVIDVVTDVICTPAGLEVVTVQLSGADYDNAVIRHFLALTDVTQKSYTGNQGRAVVVNANATGLEFGPVIGEVADTFIGLTDTPQSYGSPYSVLTVSSTGSGVSFSSNQITTIHSITGGGNPNNPNSWNSLKLVGDKENPGSLNFYGSNSSGEKGWLKIEFKFLNDCPSTYSNSASKLVAVKQDESGLEFVDNYFTTLMDCPSEYTGAAGNLIRVNNTETGLEFYSLDLTDLQDDITELQADVATLQSEMLEVQQAIITINNDLETLSTTLTNLGTTVSIHTGQISQLESTVSTLESTVSTHSSEINSLQADLGTVQASISQLESDVNSLQSTVSTLTGDISGINSSISTLQTDLSNLNTTVGQLTTQVTTLESTVTSLESTVNSLDSTVSSHTTSISNLESSVTTLQGQVSTLEGTVSTHTGQISTLESGLVTAESNITQIQSDLSSIQTDIQTVTTGLTQAQSDIIQLQSDVTQHGSDIADILSRLSTAEANIQSLQTDLATAQGSIAALQSDLATAQNDISSNYSSLDARITALGG